MNKTVLAIDGNFLLYSTLSVLQVFSNDSDSFLLNSSDEDKRKDANMLLEKLSIVYSKDIRSFASVVNDVVIVTDGGRSWRKDLYLTKNYKGISKTLSYKSNREKEEHIDWSFIFKIFESFVQGLNKTGNVKYHSIQGCEGDDLLAVYSSYANNQSVNVIIYSGDSDLKQCVNYNKSTNTFTMLYQKQVKKVWIDYDTAVFLKNTQSDYFTECLICVFKNLSCTLSVCEPFVEVLSKILSGDTSDNIFSVVLESRPNKTGKNIGLTKEYKISPTMVTKIINEIDYKNYAINDLFTKEFKSKLANSAIRNFKSSVTFLPDDIENNIEVNTDLVLLHKNIIPKQLYDDIIDWCENINNQQTCNLKTQFISNNILQNIEMYNKKEYDNAQKASIFKHLGL